MMGFATPEAIVLAVVGISMGLCLVLGRVWALALYISSFAAAGIVSVFPSSIPPLQQLSAYGAITLLVGWAIKKRPLHGLHARDIGRLYQASFWALAVSGSIVIHATRLYYFNVTSGGIVAMLFASDQARWFWAVAPALLLISMKRKVQHVPPTM